MLSRGFCAAKISSSRQAALLTLATLATLATFATLASCVGDDASTSGSAEVPGDAQDSDRSVDAGADSTPLQDAPTDTPTDGPRADADADADAGPASKRVFITSTDYDGNLRGGSANGALGADAKCQARADTAGLGGTYRAWISPTTNVAQSAVVDRFSKPAVPHVRIDGQRVAPNWAALITGTLEVPIIITELGTDVTAAAPLAWSGTTTSGTPAGSFSTVCDDWTANNGVASGQYGTATATDGTWTFANMGKTCNERHRLYCFEQ